MAVKDLIVDTYNFSSLCPKGNYFVSFNSVDGGQGGVMLSGGEQVDELCVKEVIRFPFYPLTDSQIQQVLQVVMPTPVHSVHYYSPEKGERTVNMIRSLKEVRYRGEGVNGEDYWSGVELVFREKD